MCSQDEGLVDVGQGRVVQDALRFEVEKARKHLPSLGIRSPKGGGINYIYIFPSRKFCYQKLTHFVRAGVVVTYHALIKAVRVSNVDTIRCLRGHLLKTVVPGVQFPGSER